MEINCLSCGHKIELGDAYDDYKGQIKCWICSAILEVRTAEGGLKSAKIMTTASPASIESASEGST